MMDARDVELDAMRANFRSLSRRWGLGPSETRALIGDERSRAGEEAQRTLLEVDRAMRALFGEDGVRCWLKEDGPGGLSPLDFLQLGENERRAMLAAARLRHRQIIGFDL